MTNQAQSELQDSEPRILKAALLSLLSPGLGLVYVGHFLAGLFINLLFVFSVIVFVVAVSVWKFFPLYPFLVLLSVWLVLSGLSAWSAQEIISSKQAQRGRSYQHPLFYLVIALLSFAIPVALTAHFTARYLFSVAGVSTLAMYPQAQPGDRLLIDRTVFRNTSPQRGDLVAVRIPQTGKLAILRVVAVPNDTVEMQGHTLLINDDFVDYSPFDPQWSSVALLDDESLEILVEHNHDRRYVVSVMPGVDIQAGVSGLELPEDHYFLLADNRSILNTAEPGPLEVDSRIIGPVTRENIEGSPLYITWSQNPQTGSPRWNRIGLPTD